MLNDLSLCNKILWFIVLNVFCKFIKSILVSLFLLIFLSYLFIREIRVFLYECFGLKLDW